MTALSIIIDIVLILISIVLIVAVLMQEGQRQGLGAIGGGAETFFGKNKAKSMEGRLQKYTKIAAAVFIVLAIVATVITSHNAGGNVTVTDVAEEAVEGAAEETEEAAEEAAAEVEEAAEEAAAEVEGAAEEAAAEVEEAAEGAAAEVEEAAENAEAAVEEAVEDAEAAVEEAAEAPAN